MSFSDCLHLTPGLSLCCWRHIHPSLFSFMTALFESFLLMRIGDISSVLTPTYFHFIQVGKPILDKSFPRDLRQSSWSVYTCSLPTSKFPQKSQGCQADKTSLVLWRHGQWTSLFLSVKCEPGDHEDKNSLEEIQKQWRYMISYKPVTVSIGTTDIHSSYSPVWPNTWILLLTMKTPDVYKLITRLTNIQLWGQHYDNATP